MPLTRKLLHQTLQRAQEATQTLGRHFDEPEYIEVGPGKQFRHAQQTDLLQSWLKCIRAVSTLNASAILLEKGFFQEIGALCRGVDEFTQDVLFLATPLGEEGLSKQQTQLVEEFFQEEFSDLEDPVTSINARNRVPRKKILAGIGRIQGNPLNPSDSQALQESLYKAFSGYVHGAYVHIMEMYGGQEGNLHFHMRGVDSAQRYQEWLNWIASCLFRTLIAISVVARRCEDGDVTDMIESEIKSFSATMGSDDEEPRSMLARLKARSKKT
jgi:hypothetical protein